MSYKVSTESERKKQLMLSMLHIIELSKEKVKRKRKEKIFHTNNKINRQQKKKEKKRLEMKSTFHIIRKKECLYDFDSCCNKKKKKEKKQKQKKIKCNSYACTHI